MEVNKRLAALRSRLKSQGLVAILISQPENRRYLSGFTGSAGHLIITASSAILATDFRYVEQVKRQAPSFELHQTSGSISCWLPQLLLSLSIRDLAFEANAVTVSQLEQLTKSAGNLKLTLTPSRHLVENLRMVKEPEEIELITKAVAIADVAMTHAAEILKPGLTELALGWEIECFMRTHGSEALPFEVIVAAGPNAALPHARPSERPIGRGEPVVIDIGARVGGYVSDLTRTLCVGKQGAKFKEIYNTVLRAQSYAEDNITAGMTGHEADNLARSIIDTSGHGERFGHGLGHGLGLVAHEEPRLGPNSEDILQEYMVFTVEPGIYLPGWGGVRIEDTVILKNGKITALSHSPK